jgi:hypothetical protein
MFLSCCQSLLTTSHSKVAPELTSLSERRRALDGLELDLFAESNVTIGDGFRLLLPLAADAEGRNPETYLDCLRH